MFLTASPKTLLSFLGMGELGSSFEGAISYAYVWDIWPYEERQRGNCWLLLLLGVTYETRFPPAIFCYFTVFFAVVLNEDISSTDDYNSSSVIDLDPMLLLIDDFWLVCIFFLGVDAFSVIVLRVTRPFYPASCCAGGFELNIVTFYGVLSLLICSDSCSRSVKYSLKIPFSSCSPCIADCISSLFRCIWNI